MCCGAMLHCFRFVSVEGANRNTQSLMAPDYSVMNYFSSRICINVVYVIGIRDLKTQMC